MPYTEDLDERLRAVRALCMRGGGDPGTAPLLLLHWRCDLDAPSVFAAHRAVAAGDVPRRPYAPRPNV